jgi:hypothetical protein
MRRIRTKALREKVLEDMGYEPNEQETAREIQQYPEFRKIFRAKKKNFLSDRQRQMPKLVDQPVSPAYQKWFKKKLQAKRAA